MYIRDVQTWRKKDATTMPKKKKKKREGEENVEIVGGSRNYHLKARPCARTRLMFISITVVSRLLPLFLTFLPCPSPFFLNIAWIYISEAPRFEKSAAKPSREMPVALDTRAGSFSRVLFYCAAE